MFYPILSPIRIFASTFENITLSNMELPPIRAPNNRLIDVTRNVHTMTSTQPSAARNILDSKPPLEHQRTLYTSLSEGQC